MSMCVTNTIQSGPRRLQTVTVDGVGASDTMALAVTGE